MPQRLLAREMELLNAAVAAFAHRAISERDAEILASEALSYIAAGLQADRVDLFWLSADRRSLELKRRFPTPRDIQPESLPARGTSIAAEAVARRGVVIRPVEGEGYGAATMVACDDEICVFVAYAQQRPFIDAAQTGLDAIAAMYAAAMARCAAEARVAASERRLRLMLDQIPAVVSTLDSELRFTSAQGAALRERPETSIIGRPLAEVIDGDENSPPVLAARSVLAGEATQWEWTWEGRAYENRMEPLRDAEGEIVGVVNLGIDVTEKRRADAELRESREELRRLSAAMHMIQENERRRIAREIHDDLGQRLTALKLDLGLLRAELGGERAAAMLELVDEILATARRVARELRPAILDDFGFAAAVEHEAESFARRAGVDVSVKIEPKDMAIEPARATALYRVIQEALTNVARHAGATRVDVRVEKAAGAIVAEVRDNGRGITAEESSNPGALGLVGIRERIFALNGTVVIENVDGGTRVLVSVPDEHTDRG